MIANQKDAASIIIILAVSLLLERVAGFLGISLSGVVSVAGGFVLTMFVDWFRFGRKWHSPQSN